MELEEIALGIPIESAFANLVRLNLDERVVAALFLHREMKRAEYSRVRPRSGGVRSTIERKSWKEFIGDLQHVCGQHLRSEKMSHVTTPVPSDY